MRKDRFRTSAKQISSHFFQAAILKIGIFAVSSPHFTQ